MGNSPGNKIGGSPKSLEDEILLKGEARFISDIKRPKLLYAEFLRSDYAHARIVELDISAAQEMPGVVMILTGKDCREESFGSIRPFVVHKREDGSEMFVPENLPLTDSKVVSLETQ